MGYLDFLFVGYSGRIGRLTYWVASFALSVIELVVIWGLLQLAHGTLADLTQYSHGDEVALSSAQAWDVFQHVVLPAIIVSLVFLWPQYAVTTKRWHDRGKSGWWSLIVLVPIIGALWAFIELGFLPGENGVNHYGYR